jgi:hypothetical protein
MKERPILFSTEMVQAILEGRKSQTRRIMNPQPSLFDRLWMWTKKKMVYALPNQGELETSCLGIWQVCPYGKSGDRLWVRETWGLGAIEDTSWDHAAYIAYKADGKIDLPIDYKKCKRISLTSRPDLKTYINHWRPSIHIPHWASRITLEVVNVRVERVRDITEDDALAEGCEPVMRDSGGVTPWGAEIEIPCYHEGYAELWDKINAKRGYGWDANPYVWVIEFKVLP